MLDNQVSALLCELPVHISDPVERLEAVREQMVKLKASHISDAGEMITTIGNLAHQWSLVPSVGWQSD